MSAVMPPWSNGDDDVISIPTITSRSLWRSSRTTRTQCIWPVECFVELTLISLFLLVLCGIRCWWHFSPNGITRHRREKEEKAQKRIDEYKQQRYQQQQQAGSDEMVVYRVYEICYNGSMAGKGDGYGHGELHLAISSLSPSAVASDTNNNDCRRIISGCGMRELEYTEIIDGYIDLSNGYAEWTERTQREISYVPPPGLRDRNYDYGIGEYNDLYLSKHLGPVSIKSKGKFSVNNIDNESSAIAMKSFEGEYFGRDECQCNNCRLFWLNASDPDRVLHWTSNNYTGTNNNDTNTSTTTTASPATILGEPIRWCPDEERRRIGEYILFRLKEEEGKKQTRVDQSDGNTSNTQRSGGEGTYHRMV